MKKIHNFYFPDWDTHFKDFFSSTIGYQEAQRNRALAQVKNFEVAVDCGAHVGLWSRDLGNFFEKLICFEPVSIFFECLKLNIKSNNVLFVNKALGKSDSVGKIKINSSGNSGASKIVYQNYKILNSESIEKIQITKLDKFQLKKLDFFKIDVEGGVLDVLIGSKNTLIKCKPVICVEMFENDKDYFEQINFLNQLGYKLIDKIIKEHVFIKET